MIESALAVVSILGTVSSITFAYLAFSRNRRQENTKEGEYNGKILTEMGYIKSGIDDIKKKQDIEDERHIEIVSRLVAVEASAKQAHKRIDALTGSGERRD